ncbi:MAG: hypothetical protein IT537_30495 [Hyphomicrobiales bacterium]|nr:hypothetical protein [Hyphomicrobiales bacterium]
MSFRITPATLQLLTSAAGKSGRTVSQETEHQLRRALVEMGDGPTYALMRVIGRAIDSLVDLKNPDARWTDDPYLFGQATKAIGGALEVMRPAGAPGEIDDALDRGGRHQGRLVMLELLREIQLADDPSPRTQHQRALAVLRSDLGALADRPRLYGRTSEQTRQEHQLAAQLVPLMRKAERQPDKMQPEDWQRLRSVAGKLADVCERQFQQKDDEK